MKNIFTSESVTEGHPDKVCDRIADSILDEMLKGDSQARSAVEVVATTGLVLVMGEVTTDAYIDIPSVVRHTIKDIGYDNPEYGFDYRTCSVLSALDEQSPDIAMGVNNSLEHKEGGESYDLIGAGDQGMMFGFACNETPQFMPMPIMSAHALAAKLAEVRKNREVSYLRPDGKAQVSVQYDNGKVERIDTVVLSAQHSPDVSIEKLRKDLEEIVIRSTIPNNLIDNDTKIYINPTGRFVVGGPMGDSGLTGRKIIVDTYGGYAPHGGGSFSGKDPTKVDRSAAYFARYVAKNVVAAGLASKCELQVAYAIGKARPVSISVNTFGTGKVSDVELGKVITEVFDFRPRAIIDSLKLATPVYALTSNYGHFGKEGFTWENVSAANELKSRF